MGKTHYKEFTIKDNDIKQALLEIEEIKLKDQLRAIREVMKGKVTPTDIDREKRKSQLEYIYQLLLESRTPLHVTEISTFVSEKFGVEFYRESIVSALLKKDYRYDRFIKTGRNTFGLIEHRDLYRFQAHEG
ncbi:MAG: hypothetical protein Q8M98_03895 [Candidatus Cloacimonadaceae bacterium]|nr:hypothetical protein [Candidatus Cloacimonadaceae bacterium]